MTRQMFLKSVLAVVVALAVLVIPTTLWGQGNSAAAFDRVKAVQEANTNVLMAKAGVVGTAIGEGQGAQPIVLVLVEHGAVPGIPTSLQGVPVRPLVTGKIYALGKGGNRPSLETTRPIPRRGLTGLCPLACQPGIWMSLRAQLAAG